MKDFLEYVIELIVGLLFEIFKKSILAIATFDRKVVKRYTGIETPVYKLWWKHNVKNIQNQINNQINIKTNGNKSM